MAATRSPQLKLRIAHIPSAAESGIPGLVPGRYHRRVLEQLRDRRRGAAARSPARGGFDRTSSGLQRHLRTPSPLGPGDYVSFHNPTPYQLGSAKAQVFAKDCWGGTFHDDFRRLPGEIVIHEHWGSNGFANTDLDLQLKQHIVLIGLVANTCLEATGRFGMELGYHVTLVADATSAFSPEAMHSAHAINGPTFAHAIVTTEELVEQLSA
ncbi:isochorismatase family protein [Arthrobacter sp. 2RAF6]|uniref:isochorismatase family protein n=1 Tax=Arthrobacter sp. 2RAF6 TaxID=3233002 RepID=UPI003F8E4788